MEREYELTGEQKKAYAENEADLSNFETQMRNIQGTANSRLAAANLRFDPDAPYCYQCPCEQFKGPQHSCARPTCGHSRLRHNGFI
ncbi:hypothetical protein [Streptomyces sp. NPDC020681]|uniref:hypothetical protein n=1 Tax=Streptomyces sp. NPDC020681 TaxID=3365083 RepID=UPI00378B7658